MKNWICPTTTCISSSMEFWRISTSCLSSSWEGTPGSATTGDFDRSHFYRHLGPSVTIYIPPPSIHYMVYWLHLHPGVKHSGLTCHSPLEHTGESVEEYVNSYNRECPKGRQRGRARQELEAWDAQKEAQGEAEEEPEPQPQPELQPRSLSLWKKYGIIRLS